MAKLSDIASVGIKVPIGDATITVRGVSVRGVLSLIARFKGELAKLNLAEGLSGGVLMQLGPDVVAAIIAAGCGQPGNAAAEAIADELGLSVQLEILDAILGETVPSGLDPFVNRIAALASRLDPAIGAQITAAYSDVMAEMRSRQESISSSAPDTAAATSGG